MKTVRIGIIGDFDATKPAHIATNEALAHCAQSLGIAAETLWLPTDGLMADITALGGFDALFCAPGSPYKSFAGAIEAIRYAREQNLPFLGTCGGFQHGVMEYAINVLGIEDARHEEITPGTGKFVVSALSCSLVGQTGKVLLCDGSMSKRIYNSDETLEKFNCSYGLNADYLPAFEQSGLRIGGVDENGSVRIFELPQNGFYLLTLFLPQLSSLPDRPHRLIVEYLRCTMNNQREACRRA